MKTLLGAHISIAGGIYLAPRRGAELACTAIQIFLKNAMQWQAKPYNLEEITQFKDNLSKSNIKIIVAHDTYLINLGSNNSSLLSKSRQAFLDELKRCYLLDIPYLIAHPGAHGGAGEEKGLETIAESLNYVFAEMNNCPTMVLLETTAGQGTTLGHSFDHLGRIIELTESKARVGVCFDTCHVYAAGYDISSEKGYHETIRLFNQAIGLKNLKAFHLNDSKRELNSHVDRHEHIGMGKIGLLPFKLIMSDPNYSQIPKIIETPKGDNLGGDLDRKNLNLLRSFVTF
ncbi:MAG: deoxyribonuclease IV [Candidatus Tectomicrobia bacterium]|uniref:Probable endonuclease 4 n=1 Tax=Tectimicrobiota bacterium TaxID=2528274 RepID=A0A933GL56_UNCTE|nr:deoxyribonuclease IV [Candidatus Tectomicrobia bacterium]